MFPLNKIISTHILCELRLHQLGAVVAVVVAVDPVAEGAAVVAGLAHLHRTQ